MNKRQAPTHPQGWKFSGACGAYRVWHAGKNDYRITFEDEVVDCYEQLGLAFAKACRLSDIAKAGL